MLIGVIKILNIGATKGVRPEWHLLKLFEMSIFDDDFSGFGARFGEYWVTFGPSFDGARFDAARTMTDFLLGD